MEMLGEKKCFIHSTLFHTYIHTYDDSVGQLTFRFFNIATTMLSNIHFLDPALNKSWPDIYS